MVDKKENELNFDDIKKDLDEYGASIIERKFIVLFVIIAFIPMMLFTLAWLFITFQPGKIRSYCEDLPPIFCKMWNI